MMKSYIARSRVSLVLLNIIKLVRVDASFVLAAGLDVIGRILVHKEEQSVEMRQQFGIEVLGQNDTLNVGQPEK